MSPSPRDSLTARSIRAFWFFGLALLAVFAGLVLYALIQIGDRIYARQMMAEMEHVMSRIEAGTPIQEALPSSAFLKGYVGLESLPAKLRPHLADRSDGIHEIVHELGGGPWGPLGGRLNYHVAIRTPPANGQRLFLLYDASRLEIDEDWTAAQPWALVAGLVVIVPLGLWWGRRLAHRTVAPIVELAGQVERSGPGELAAPDGPQSYPQEVEVLAEALRQAAHRVNQFVARERRFTRNASHELRTPITVIRGAVELLDDSVRPDNDRTRRLVVGRIARSVERMEGIIEAFLWLAREADGRTETEWCRLEELLPALVEQHRHLARGKDVEVRLEPGDGLLVRAPEPVLSIAVGNLLANALTETSQGWVSIVLEENRLTISDTGPGIEPERLDAVTRPYVTGGSGGHGLGLAIVQEICERFGWRLELHSRHGEGTRAVLRFQTI